MLGIKNKIKTLGMNICRVNERETRYKVVRLKVLNIRLNDRAVRGWNNLYRATSSDPMDEVHTLDQASEAPILRLFVTIQLLIKEEHKKFPIFIIFEPIFTPVLYFFIYISLSRDKQKFHFRNNNFEEFEFSRKNQTWLKS